MQRSRKRTRRTLRRRRSVLSGLIRSLSAGRRYARPGRHARHRYRIVWQRFIPCAAFIIMGAVSLSLLISYGASSISRKHANAQLAIEYSEAFIQEEATAAPAPAVTEAPAAPAALSVPQPMPVSTFRSLEGKPMSQAQKLYKQNKDLVGWLYVKGIVSLPVVYRDNEYYLDHNFNKKADKGGTLFLDENHPLTEQTQNLVIHGHNMQDSSMFGILSTYINPGVVRSNPFATFSTMFAKEDYVVFAVMKVDPDVHSYRYFSYIGKPTFKNEADFYSYTGEMKEKSLFTIPVDVKPSDSLLTLATCVEDERLVVVFRRLREGETKKGLQALVQETHL